jgi:hypothetical protein
MTCLELIKFLELLDLYIAKNWSFRTIKVECFIGKLLEESKKIKSTNRLEKLFQKSTSILIKSIKNNKLSISENSFRMKLAFSLLFT